MVRECMVKILRRRFGLFDCRRRECVQPYRSKPRNIWHAWSVPSTGVIALQSVRNVTMELQVDLDPSSAN